MPLGSTTEKRTLDGPRVSKVYQLDRPGKTGPAAEPVTGYISDFTQNASMANLHGTHSLEDSVEVRLETSPFAVPFGGTQLCLEVFVCFASNPLLIIWSSRQRIILVTGIEAVGRFIMAGYGIQWPVSVEGLSPTRTPTRLQPRQSSSNLRHSHKCHLEPIRLSATSERSLLCENLRWAGLGWCGRG